MAEHRPPKGEFKDCHPFIELPSSEFDQGGLISRQVFIPGGDIYQMVFQFHRDGPWRLSIMEADNVGRIDVRVTTRTAMADELIMFCAPPQSGVQYWGQGSALVEVKCPDGDTTISAQLTPPAQSQYLLTYDEDSDGLAVGQPYTNVGSNNGHPQPFMNYASIYCSNNFDIRLLSPGGIVIYEDLNVPPGTALYNRFKMNNTDRLQIRPPGVAMTLRCSWFNHH